ncbi:MAG: hypothetical protein C4547_15900 [Phycisphaerales bacterium]|nr:MAG: hypothetical protein C4547_15900 [Phycisphaerales bacterium]
MYEAGKPTLDHLDRLTDTTGLIQHAIYSLPRRESGYTIDDNARALFLCVHQWSRRPQQRTLDRITRYLSLLEYARRRGSGFYNLMTYQRQWLDTDSRGDCQGQAIRALAEVLGSELPDDYRLLARELIQAAIPTLAELRSLRAQAYVVLAYGRLRAAGITNIERLEEIALSSARNLVDCYNRSRRPDWRWFESRMTYANAVMPHALLIAAECWSDPAFLEVGEDSLAFLNQETTQDDVFWPVGNNGWYSHGEGKSPYDQQPVEAATMADAAFAALRVLANDGYHDVFDRARGWFHGRNSLKQPLVDARTGGCCDGLQSGGVNRNQGAESTWAYLWTEELALCLGERTDPERTASQLVI